MSGGGPAAAVAPPADGELLVVVGPTASGKTALAIELAHRFDGEIVSADSVQVYRHFDLGSGKPTAAEREQARHHLVDVADPLEPLDAARYAALADAAVRDIRDRGKLPIVCGGTFLWVRALLHGLAEAAPRDDAVRARHRAAAESLGNAALHEQLRAVDPLAASRLAVNDVLRVSRALEIHELSGRTMSEWHAEHGFATIRYPHRLLGPHIERDDLDRRIEARARAWLEAGWIEQVADLARRGYGEARAMGAVGFREVRAHLDGRIDRAELLPLIVRSTRVFVRRQRTWLRDEPISWLR